ncbi:MAG: hypothetical protein ABI867_21400, partial [Kofleriaceae bacterium]
RLAGMRQLWLAVGLVLLATQPVLAERRDGANHHLGDDSFVAKFGHAPTSADSEKLRMHVHLAYVRDELGARAATRPELAARRGELLGYLDDYIAAGITPRNTYVPWRSPVFIDRDGRICAVGYLIERSAGRALPELVAAEHRIEYLEDIAAAVPEVASWVASSGLTLDELASIQPGYQGPDVQFMHGWEAEAIVNGAYTNEATGLTGRFKHKQMTGAWRRVQAETGLVLGRGTFHNGSGTWVSFRSDGSRIAEGAFADNRATGEWRFFHPSGRIAAIGTLRNGQRAGRWTFFRDDKARTRLSTGRFKAGEVVAGWQHFDANGTLVATQRGRAWHNLALDIEPGTDGVRRGLHYGQPMSGAPLRTYELAGERVFETAGALYDRRGNALVKTTAGWQARSCTWSAKLERAAHSRNLTALHDALDDAAAECTGESSTVTPARAKRLDTMLASRKIARGTPPVALGTGGPIEEAASSDSYQAPDADDPKDLVSYLGSHMGWYAEWPHVDDTFVAVFKTLPGYAHVD